MNGIHIWSALCFGFLRLSTALVTNIAMRNMEIKNLPGISAPLQFFDPLKLSRNRDSNTIFKYRESELKHGRFAMAAVLGWLLQEKFHPLYPDVSSNPLNSLWEIPPLTWVQMITAIGLAEWYCSTIMRRKDSQPGDYLRANRFIEDNESDQAAWKDYQTRELNNGRLAMFAILGQITHAILTGKGALAQLGL